MTSKGTQRWRNTLEGERVMMKWMMTTMEVTAMFADCMIVLMVKLVIMVIEVMVMVMANRR